eukprot:UN04296
MFDIFFSFTILYIFFLKLVILVWFLSLFLLHLQYKHPIVYFLPLPLYPFTPLIAPF